MPSEKNAPVRKEIPNASQALQAIQGVSGKLFELVIQWCNDQSELEKYIGKTIGQIAGQDLTPCWARIPETPILEAERDADAESRCLGVNWQAS